MPYRNTFLNVGLVTRGYSSLFCTLLHFGPSCLKYLSSYEAALFLCISELYLYWAVNRQTADTSFHQACESLGLRRRNPRNGGVDCYETVMVVGKQGCRMMGCVSLSVCVFVVKQCVCNVYTCLAVYGCLSACISLSPVCVCLCMCGCTRVNVAWWICEHHLVQYVSCDPIGQPMEFQTGAGPMGVWCPWLDRLACLAHTGHMVEGLWKEDWAFHHEWLSKRL